MSVAQVKYTAKDSVFTDLFSKPRYRFELFKTLHPEAEDITEDDIQLITLKPVIINQPYNDLGILVRGRLMIFVEAQSRWSGNVFVRILLYLALTWKDYIAANRLDLYGTRLVQMPMPEFYVICSERRNFPKDVYSMAEELWGIKNAPIDLKVKAIFKANKNDIIGQYITFCHVLNDQEKVYGRTREAAESTINICLQENVLKDYMEEHRKEVMDIMITLFDQETAVEFYAETKARDVKVQAIVETSQEYGASMEQAAKTVAKKCGLSYDDAMEAVKEHWKAPEAV